MSTRHLEPSSHRADDTAQELVDSIVAAVDLGRATEIEHVRRALEPLGLSEAFTSELRLSGVESVCHGDCLTHAVGVEVEF